MRYRHLSNRYTMVTGVARHWSLGAYWSVERPTMGSRTAWRPPTDVDETASNITVTIALAGIPEEQIEITLYDNALVIEGERRLPRSEPRGVYHSAEIQQGPFRAEVSLPEEIDRDNIKTHHDQGLLQIVIPKALK